MRRMLLILMIVLAPLRGWAGEVMALQMAAQQLAAAASKPVANGLALAEHQPGSVKSATLHGDCMGSSFVEAAAAVAAQESHDVHAATQCPTCSACQSCSLPALAALIRIPSVIQLSHAVPTLGGTTFSSAEPAPGLKPPIS